MSVYQFPNPQNYQIMFFNRYRQLGLIDKNNGDIIKGFVLRDQQELFNRYIRIWNDGSNINFEISTSLPAEVYGQYVYDIINGGGCDFFSDCSKLIVGTGDLRLRSIKGKTETYDLITNQNNGLVIWNSTPNLIHIYSTSAPDTKLNLADNYHTN